MKIVQFHGRHVAKNGSGYNGGEIAGFPDAEADDLVNGGIARFTRQPATLKELEAEIISRGYSKKAAKKIARERFNGEHGDGSRYLDLEGTSDGQAIQGDLSQQDTQADTHGAGAQAQEQPQQQDAQAGSEGEDAQLDAQPTLLTEEQATE